MQHCAFESVILNINDRQCFSESLPFSSDHYRRIWMTDFKNRTANDKTLNIYSPRQWEDGWNEMMESGVYERGFFGDLMIFGIACGVRKIILIFNTSLDSPHDPIYVCDPRKFGIEPNTSVPVLLAYDLSHYESLHPLTTEDTKKTCDLVDQYISGSYPFGRNDFEFLLNTDEPDERERISEIPEDISETQKERPNDPKLLKEQKSLPEHLRGKRLKDMDAEERKEYNNFMKKKSKQKERLDHADIRKQKEAKAQATKRAKETSPESQDRPEIRKKIKAKAQATKRAERKERNESKAKADATKRANETSTERKGRNESKAKAIATKRAKETAAERERRNESKVIADATKRAKETSAERKGRNESKAKTTATKRAK